MSAQMGTMGIQYPGGNGDQCCASCRSPNCKNRWALPVEVLGVAGLGFNLAMLADVDDILKCPFTTVVYFIAMGFSGVFFIATASRLSGYKGCFNAHPICRASTYMYTYCCDDGCEGMTEYRKGPLQDGHVLVYIFLNVLIPGELIPLVASYLDNINGYVKAVGLKIEHPAVLWLAIIGRPVVALGQVIFAGWDVYAQKGCSYGFKCLLVLGISYIVILGVVYGLAFGDVFDCWCPRFFNGTTMCDNQTAYLNSSLL